MGSDLTETAKNMFHSTVEKLWMEKMLHHEAASAGAALKPVQYQDVATVESSTVASVIKKDISIT